jgi:DNA polymerase/3'-5' exonuclease PolX
MNELCQIHGIGPKFAEKLVNQNIMSIEDLKTKKVALSHPQQIGLKYHKEFSQKIPRGEMDLIKNEVENSIKKVDKNILMQVCGSYRRKKDFSGDIDILITQEKSSSKSFDDYTVVDHVVKQLQQDKLITDVLSEGTKKFMGVCILPDSIDEFKPHLHRRLDSMSI